MALRLLISRNIMQASIKRIAGFSLRNRDGDRSKIVFRVVIEYNGVSYCSFEGILLKKAL